MSGNFLEIKKKLHDHLNGLLDRRISNAAEASQSAEESKNAETKSSAGDKFETGRAMMQIEQEKIKLQLANSIQLKNTLAQLDSGLINITVKFGSIVHTDNANFFISIGLGKVIIEEQTYFAISVDSPISRALFGSSAGEKINFQDKVIEVLEVN